MSSATIAWRTVFSGSRRWYPDSGLVAAPGVCSQDFGAAPHFPIGPPGRMGTAYRVGPTLLLGHLFSEASPQGRSVRDVHAPVASLRENRAERRLSPRRHAATHGHRRGRASSTGP